jgi:hypothetical protein
MTPDGGIEGILVVYNLKTITIRDKDNEAII